MLRLRIFLWCIFIFVPVCAQDSRHLDKIFSTPSLRVEIAKFLDNVLRQVSSDDLLSYVDNIRRHAHPRTDKEYYQKIIKKIRGIKPAIPLYSELKLLQHQKNILGAQAQQLIGAEKKCDGCVEIGTPGTYIWVIKNFLPATGNITVIHDKQKLTDMFQAFLPSRQFVQLNNYEPISSDGIPDKSVDLVVCFIGLHHVPIEKLDAFVASICRILRPGVCLFYVTMMFKMLI